jgi:UDP-N-acetylmuramoyl-tripeptide--D-alanyl-D-alanine ligase
MALFTLEGIAAILRSKNIGADVKEISTVSIDSKHCSKHALFIGLKGQRANGADFMEEAFQNGAECAITDFAADEEENRRRITLAKKYNAGLFYVDNPLYALQDLAKHHVKRFPDLIKIAITGSSGKTTVKEMLYGILREDGKTVATMGNLNSESGLPLSCFSIEAKHKYAVLEMGMNRTGEIAELAAIFKPDYAVITNIGTAHIGFLGSQEAIAREKKAVASQFTGNETLFVPQDDSYAAYLAQNVNGKVIFYAPTLLKRFDHVEDLGLDGYKIYLDRQSIRVHFTGRHNLINACLAIYVAQEIGLKTKVIKEGLEKVLPTAGRSEIIRGRITLIKDCYNASPEGMKAALQAVSGLKYARKVVFLAEMRELGDESRKAHEELVQPVLDARLDAVFLLGPDMIYLSTALREKQYWGYIEYSSSYEILATALLKFLTDGDLLLIKGSRFYALERLEEPLMKKGLIWPVLKGDPTSC